MNLKMNYSETEINEKQSLLDNAAYVLKREFIGIENVIDCILHSIHTWFLFPDLQERPLIINLWGMTGVGKTALIERLSQLLNFEKKFFRYDMGKNSFEDRSLGYLLNKNILQNGAPYIILLDEFQYAKTKNEDRREITNTFSRDVWDILDSGIFQISRYIDRDIERMISWKNVLTDCLNEGVEVMNGIVIKNEDLFIEILSQIDDYLGIQVQLDKRDVPPNQKLIYPFLTDDLYKIFYDYLPETINNIIQFKRIVKTLNGPQIIELLTKSIENAKSNKCVDCTKTVIFIAGNLDEAYAMSNEFNPDINANEFHEASKLININHIKKSLQLRFRNEQIARLGNNHIIYPAFNEESFKKLIELELLKISAKTFERFGMRLTFTDAFKSLLYREGVFPTQGTRPLFSTTYQLVNTKIPKLVSETILRNIEADSISFDFLDNNIRYDYIKNDCAVHSFNERVELSMEKLRLATRDDVQAITAVHESGHAVVTLKALEILPEYICTTSADVDAMGFTLVKNKWKYFSKEKLVNKIAQLLGGIAAEKIIFGENKITKGAEEDIELATTLAAKVIKDYGMGSFKASIQIEDVKTKYCYHDQEGIFNNEVRALMSEGYNAAEKILLEEKNLLLKLSDYLCDERIIKKEQIAKLAREYGSNELKDITFIENTDNLFYRNELKKQVGRINHTFETSREMPGMIISLNKNL